MIHNITLQPKITNVRTSSLKIYLQEINQIPLLTIDDEIKYGAAALAGDEKAVKILIESNLRFVVSIAKAYNNHYSHLEDLINEGNNGLMVAARKFDPTRGFKFISYAVWYIRSYIMRYLSITSRYIRFPQNIIKNVYALDGLNRMGNAIPTDEELNKLGWSEEKYLDSVRLSQMTVSSLDYKQYEDLVPLINIIPNNDIEPTDKLSIESSKLLNFNRFLSRLPKRSVDIVTKFYGFNNKKRKTLTEISDEYDLTRQRVSQIIREAIRRLKRDASRLKLDIGYFE